MKKFIWLAVVAVLIIIGVIFYFNLKQAITLKDVTLDATLVTRDTMEMELNMVVDNPFFFSFELNQLTYYVSVGGRELFSEHQTIHKTIDDSTLLQLPITFNYDRVFSHLEEVQAQDSTFLSFDFDISYTLPVLGSLTTSINDTKKIPVPPLIDVQIEDIDIESFGFQNIDLEVQMQIDNPSKKAMKLDNLVFDVKLNESTLVEGMKWQTANIPEKERTPFTLPIEVTTGALAKEFFDKLTEGEEINLYLDGSALLVIPDSPIDSIDLVIDTEGAIKR